MKKQLFIFALMAILLAMTSGCAPGTVLQINNSVATAQTGTAVPNGQINVPGFKI